MLIIPSIYKVIGNRGCNSYIIETRVGLAIVDVGYLGSEQAILKYLDVQLGASPEDIAYIIVTHARRNCSEASVDLLTYCDEATLIIHRDDYNFFRKVTLLTNDENILILDTDYKKLEGNLELIHTPGATPGSISIKFNDSLFVGNSVYIDPTQKIQFPKQAYDLKLLKESLSKLLELDFSNIFPAHGKYILHDGKKKLSEFLNK